MLKILNVAENQFSFHFRIVQIYLFSGQVKTVLGNHSSLPTSLAATNYHYYDDDHSGKTKSQPKYQPQNAFIVILVKKNNVSRMSIIFAGDSYHDIPSSSIDGKLIFSDGHQFGIRFVHAIVV